MTSFQRPTGVFRDMNELEFIAALLQTNQKVIRTAGTVKAADIVLYLISRHGIVVPEHVVQQSIVTELAGQTQDVGDVTTTPTGVDAGPSNHNHDVIDISELTAILLIPQLLEASQNKLDNARVFTYFEAVIEAEHNKEGLLTKEGLRKLFEGVGENNVSDTLLNEMVALAAAGGDLVSALTSDVTLFDDLENYLDDKCNSKMKNESVGGKESDTKQTTEPALAVSIHTAPAIDYTADTFRRPLFPMLLWSAGISSYFAYVLKETEQGTWVTTNCDDDGSLCSIAQGIVSWLAVFLQLVVLGLPYIFLASLGNSNYYQGKLQNLAALVIGMTTIAVFTVLPFFVNFKSALYDTSGNQRGLDIGKFCSNDDLECMNACYAAPDTCPDEYESGKDAFHVFFLLSLVLGLVLLISQVVDIVSIFAPEKWFQQGGGFLQALVTPGCVRQDRASKKAASYRISQMLNNSLVVCEDDKTATTQISSRGIGLGKKESNLSPMERFLLLPKETETVGGIIWAWKKIWDGSIFVEEGVWLNGRLLACNFAQLTVVGIIIFFTRLVYNWQDDFFYSENEATDKALYDSVSEVIWGNYTNVIGPAYDDFVNCTQDTAGVDLIAEEGYIDFTQPYFFVDWLITNYTSLSEALNAYSDCVDEDNELVKFLNDTYHVVTYEPSWQKDLIVTLEISTAKYVLVAWCGFFAGFAASMYIAVTLLPSFISTVLKFRSGVIPSLLDPEFLRYRHALDTVTLLLGSAFWGSFFTATGAFVLFILFLVFVSLFPAFIGVVLGFVLILLMRTSVLLVLRCAFFAAFFRKKPGASNIMYTILEVWNIGLSLGFIFVRAAKLTAIMVLFIARIDTPFLAPGLGRIGPLELDGTSFAFRKDLLMHEAHRHVLIERFGLLCLLKLRAGDKFGSRAGSAWRFLYALTVMPWLRKYRVSRSSEEDLDEKIAEIEEELEEVTEDTTRDECDDIKVRLLVAKEKKFKQSIKQNGENSKSEIEALRYRNTYLEERVHELEIERKSLENGIFESAGPTDEQVTENTGPSY